MTSPLLPGADLVSEGIADLTRGAVTAEARLYALLCASHADGAHGRYNALVGQPVSFQRAAACAR